MHLKDGKPLSALPKIIVVPIQIWDASNISGTSIPLKRTVTVAADPEGLDRQAVGRGTDRPAGPAAAPCRERRPCRGPGRR